MQQTLEVVCCSGVICQICKCLPFTCCVAYGSDKLSWFLLNCNLPVVFSAECLVLLRTHIVCSTLPLGIIRWRYMYLPSLKHICFERRNAHGLSVTMTSESSLRTVTSTFTICKVTKSARSPRYICFLVPWFTPSPNVFSMAKSIWTRLKYEWKFGNPMAKVNTERLVKCLNGL